MVETADEFSFERLDVYQCAKRRRFYATARGSAMECAAIVELLALKRLIQGETHTEARSLLLRIVPMLTRLT